MLLLLSMAWAAPADSPQELMVEKTLLDHNVGMLWGRPHEQDQHTAEVLKELGEEALPTSHRVRMEAYWGQRWSGLESQAWNDFRWGIREWSRIALGELEPVNALGDDEGFLALRGGAEFWVRSRLIFAHVRPELRLDFGCVDDPVCGEAPLKEAVVGLQVGGASLRFGMEDRESGPGARGNLVLGRDAVPWPALTASYHQAESRLGEWAAEWGMGWLPGLREDVQNPGYLHMDFRWSPVSMLELGFTRASMFAGESRAWPNWTDLLLPLNPHASGDPEKVLSDTNELAAVDARLNLPLGAWGLGPVRRLTLWYQYGGEDMIMRPFGPIDVPALAAPANLYGAALSVGDWLWSIERAQLMDDTFRWYTGHRVYHQGFVHQGHSMGHPHGGDADSIWMSLAWHGVPMGGEIFAEHLRRTGVVDSIPEGVFTLLSDEVRIRAGGRVWFLPISGGHLGLGYEAVHVEGEEFVPDAGGWAHRAWLEISRSGL